MPALPLDEAGKYVAAAYLVFLALILIYVAIMAGRLSRIERDLDEVTDLLDKRDAAGGGRAGDGRTVSELLALGASHKTAPLAVRERLALLDGQVEPFLQELVAHPDVSRGRRGLDLQPHRALRRRRRPGAAESAVLEMLARRAGTPLGDAVYGSRNCDAARHLYRVVSGLESMIVGEAEIQGQVKRAYERALAARTTGPMTNKLFRAALATGKRVRTETAISTGNASVASVAVESARAAVGDLAERHVVIIGAGETSEQTARAFHAHGVTTMFVANRRRERAIALAQQFGGASGSFDALPGELERADVVVSSTASPHAIIEAEELAAVMEARGGRPLLLVDLAVPRDIDPLCATVDGVTLLDMDALQAQVRGHLGVRRAEAVRAEAIVEDEIQIVRLLARAARGAADADRAAHARRRDRRRRAGRERGPLGVAVGARRRARRGARALDRQAPAARADGAGQGPRRRAPPRAPVAAARAVRTRRGGGGRRGRGRRGPPAPRVTALRLGTRGSALALAQANEVARLLGGDVELVKITTAGDVDRARGDKSRWVGALESALLAGEIDLAVHSAKDVPGELAPGTVIAATPRRAEPFDVLVGEDALAAVREGARVGTSALRRRAQLLAARPDLEVCELRGNVDTRLAKRVAGEVDVLVLAAAGLDRLDRRAEAGRGADRRRLRARGRPGRDRHPGAHGQPGGRGRAARRPRADPRALDAERHVVRALEATCHTPVGVLAVRRPRARLRRPPGRLVVARRRRPATGEELARGLLAAGAAELLRDGRADLRHDGLPRRRRARATRGC